MGCDDVGGVAFGHTGSADEEGDVDVFFVGALLAGLEAVLAYVVAVVCGEDEVGVFCDAVMVESCC
jgi:hypothetical protein